MNIWSGLLFSLVFLLAVGRSFAEVGNQVVVLTGARLIDGSGRPAVENSTLVIEGDKIGDVGLSSEKYPTEALVIDCSGKTIIPGLISDHRSPGADVFGADCGIGAPSGAPPAALLPVGKDQIYRPETPDEARSEVREMAARHTDLIKIWVDPLLDTAPTMKPEIYQAVIDEAHRLGLRVAAHVYYLQNAKDVLRAGVDIIAHGVRDKPVDAEFIDEMKSRSAFYIATIGLDESSYIYAEQPDWMKGTFFQSALQPALRAQLSDLGYLNRMRTNPRVAIFKKAVATNKENLKLLFDSGVKIGFGTDSGAIPLRIPGWAEHRELQLMVESGLTPMQALECATGNAAALLKLTDRGVLEPGKLADFVILTANPLDDISNTEKIAAVWHRGKKVSGPIGSE